MLRCVAQTKEGRPCKKRAARGSELCHVHLKKQSKRRIIGITSIISVLVGSIAIAANFAQIGQWAGIHPPKLSTTRPTTRPATEIIESLLNTSDAITFDLENHTKLVSHFENKCKEDRTYMEEMKCWLILADLYSQSNNYRSALKSLTRAYEINPEIADSYYARGNVYFDLVVMDLVQKRSFFIDPDAITCTLTPDEESKTVLLRAMEEYDAGEKYPTLKNLEPQSPLVYSFLHIVGYNKRQIQDYIAG